jgi:Tfp pilus assembly protein PilO
MKFPAIISKKLLSDYFRWVAIALVVAVLALGYVLLLSVKIQTIRTSGFLEQKKTQTELESRQQFLSELRQSVEKFGEVLPPEKLKAVNEFIPSQSDFPGLLLTIRNIAATANLELDGITLGEVGQLAATGPTASVDSGTNGDVAGAPSSAQAATASGVNLQVLNASIIVSGGQNYEDFKNFLDLLESSQRLLDIVNIGFTFSEGATGSFSLQVRTYYLPSASAASAQ